MRSRIQRGAQLRDLQPGIETAHSRGHEASSCKLACGGIIVSERHLSAPLDRLPLTARVETQLSCQTSVLHFADN